MRKLAALALMTLLIFSCSGEKKKEESAKIPEVITKSSPEYSVKYNFENGEKISYSLITNINSSQAIESDTSITTSSNQKVTYTFDLTVIDVDNNEIADISVHVAAIKAAAEINGDKLEYDSKFIYSSRERMIYADYESLKGKSFKIRVTPIGEVLEIYNASKIVNELIAIQGQGQKISADQRKAFEQGFTEQGLAPMVQQLFKTMTHDKVRVNSQWSHRYPSTLGSFQIENIATFEVKDFLMDKEDSLAKINAHLSVSWTGQNQAQEQGINYTFSDPNISGFGSFTFNRTNGWVDVAESTVRMEMEMTMDSFDSNQKPIRAVKKDIVVSKNTLTRL